MHDLRCMAESNADRNRKNYTSRDTLFAASAIYQTLYGDPVTRRVPATFQVCFDQESFEGEVGRVILMAMGMVLVLVLMVLMVVVVIAMVSGGGEGVQWSCVCVGWKGDAICIRSST
eukprot:TRINITY_DN3905_c0_g2_i5.p3 TRINITY_DN3905_c0_g2~~TRINITY_DN3905_c0_g2_i5.p3  ORF type:complete len:117 (-),score=24.41 TRINITY_DN3905_c0_g2_i5:274-624(-)